MARSAKSILIVDDDGDVLEMLGLMAARSGYRVVTATDRLEALDILNKGEPLDLLLTDIIMPEQAVTMLENGEKYGRLLKSRSVLMISVRSSKMRSLAHRPRRCSTPRRPDASDRVRYPGEGAVRAVAEGRA